MRLSDLGLARHTGSTTPILYRPAPCDQYILELETQVAELTARVAELEAQLEQRDATIEKLEQQVHRLQNQLAQARRASKRQATPFARDEHVEHPQKPGRKAGKGQFTHRAKPSPDEVDRTVEAPLSCCSECGGGLTDRKEHEHFEVDIPPAGACLGAPCRHPLRDPQRLLLGLREAGTFAAPQPDFDRHRSCRCLGWASGQSPGRRLEASTGGAVCQDLRPSGDRV